MKEPLLAEMGIRLAARRKQLRMTQEEVAEKADITPQTVSTAERGEKALRPGNLLKLCEALEMSSDYLLTGEIKGTELSRLNQGIDRLTESQYHNLEEIIINFLQACSVKA